MSPLAKRLPREFRHNMGKYLGIFLLFLIAIMMGSGFLSSAYSIQVLQDGMHERYQVEDFHFATQFQAASSSISSVLRGASRRDGHFRRDYRLWHSGELALLG